MVLNVKVAFVRVMRAISWCNAPPTCRTATRMALLRCRTRLHGAGRPRADNAIAVCRRGYRKH